jgi:hypothetical protein
MSITDAEAKEMNAAGYNVHSNGSGGWVLNLTTYRTDVTVGSGPCAAVHAVGTARVPRVWLLLEVVFLPAEGLLFGCGNDAGGIGFRAGVWLGPIAG